MKNKILLTALVSFFTFCSYAQDGVTDPNFTEYQDKVPGTLLFEFGYGMLQNGSPEGVDIATFRSRTANIYYMYDFRLFGSKYISFNPGFGMGFDNYMFENSLSPERLGDSALVFLNVRQALEAVEGTTDINLQKTKLAATYFDIPMEFRFRTKPSKKSFRLAVGGKVGFLLDSKTKVKYELSGDNYKRKTKTNFGVERFRYGVHARIGFGSLNFFCYYALSELFEKDLYDQYGNKLDGNLSNVVVGLTLVTF
jgi:hypothetical protein